jgi:hypothetical protein
VKDYRDCCKQVQSLALGGLAERDRAPVTLCYSTEVIITPLLFRGWVGAGHLSLNLVSLLSQPGALVGLSLLQNIL